ncbi:glycosyl transferase family protein [Thermaurantiacus sp.]
MSPDPLIFALALAAVLTREALLVCAFLVTLNSLDDLLVDLLFPLAALAARPLPPPPPVPGRHAILVPAWDEAAVIGPMLERLTRTLDHPDYLVFVGTYPNDPETQAAVRAVASPRIRLVETSAPGPTTKADCLNHLWRAACAEAERSGRPFRAVVLHDAEDVLHPAELSVFDRALGRADMVQIPVLPMVAGGAGLISGHYLDEFAELHAKDLVVRSFLSAPLPSAGVGTAIAWQAMCALDAGRGQPFDPASLTEDYEIGYRLHRLGRRAEMVRIRVGGRLVAVREYFPETLEAAVRQKARWLAGIALSGWDRLGWGGGLAERWMLARDRKGLPVAILALVAYGLLATVLLQQLLRGLLDPAGTLPPLLDPASTPMMAMLLAATTLVLVWRLLVRAAFTTHAAGIVEGLLAIPRAPVANLVNALAAHRALARYRAALASGRAGPWDKTVHRFPGVMASG